MTPPVEYSEYGYEEDDDDDENVPNNFDRNDIGIDRKNDNGTAGINIVISFNTFFTSN